MANALYFFGIQVDKLLEKSEAFIPDFHYCCFYGYVFARKNRQEEAYVNIGNDYARLLAGTVVR
jgi:hypothetical protein